MPLSRRHALAGLVAAPIGLVTLSSVGAQTPPANTQGRSNYVDPLLALGEASILMSEAALQQSQNDNVQQFAALEIDEQRTIAGILAAIPAGEDAAVQQSPDALAPLQGLSGLDFDLAYIEAQIGLHNDFLGLHRTISGATDPTIEAVLSRMAEQGALSHIAMLNLLQQLLGAERIQAIQEGQDPAPRDPAAPAPAMPEVPEVPAAN